MFKEIKHLTEREIMSIQRKHGDVQPGIKWGKFTTRIPGIHVDFSLPEIIQGGLIPTTLFIFSSSI